MPVHLSIRISRDLYCNLSGSSLERVSDLTGTCILLISYLGYNRNLGVCFGAYSGRFIADKLYSFHRIVVTTNISELSTHLNVDLTGLNLKLNLLRNI